MDTTTPKQPLSEISHLFLSSVRDLPRPGAPRPMRIPPGAPRPEASKPQESIDLTPEEFAQVYGQLDLGDAADDQPRPTVTAVLASHLGASQADRVRQYAKHCANHDAARIGLIEVDQNDIRITRFEIGESEEPAPDLQGGMDASSLNEVLIEMNADVDRWLLVVGQPRSAETNALMQQVSQWTLLCTCDHDGVVAGYRTLKGLADITKPRLTLALLDVSSTSEGAMIHRKLGGVCEQFLRWPLVREADVESTDATEQRVLHQTGGESADGSHWAVLMDWIGTTGEPVLNIDELEEVVVEAPVEKATMQFHPLPVEEAVSTMKTSAPKAQGATSMGVTPDASSQSEAPRVAASTSAPDVAASPFRLSSMNPPTPAAGPAISQGLSFEADLPNDVVDLPTGEVTPGSMLAAIVRHQPGAMIECPVRAPMCPDAMLAVDREHGLVLLAVAQSGLADLRQIATAYQWMNQNRALLAMAMPQFAIDGHRLPQLRLLVDHRDMTADLLQPMVAVGHVTVQAYRKLRWAGRVGLLLDAA